MQFSGDFSPSPYVMRPSEGNFASSLVTTTLPGDSNCTKLDPNSATCNLTCCNFGNGCIIDFSKIDMNPWEVMPPWQVALFAIGVGCETLPGILGNVFVIVIILSNRIMRNEINMFILNMATADLISSAVLPPTFMVATIFQAYKLGQGWCTYGESVRLTLLLTSVFSLSVISVDRLWGLMRPFHEQFRPITTKIIMLATWVVAAAVAFYPSQLTKYRKRQYHDFLDIFCEEDKSAMKMYWWLIAIFLVWLPAIILFSCFLIIFMKLRHLNSNQKKSGRLRFVPPVTRARRRAVRLVFCMFVTFFVCWSPFLVYVLMYQYSPKDHDNGTAVDSLYYVSHVMMYLVPVINPLLYALMHENFRRAATVTCPWLPAKVKYQAFHTGDGGRVRWSVYGNSLPSLPTARTSFSESRRPPPLRRAHTLAEFPPERHQGGATVVSPPPPAASKPEIAVTAAEEPAAQAARLDDSRLREVALIWNALMDRQRDERALLTAACLSVIAEEGESRRTSIRSSIDLGELIRSGAGAVRDNPAFVSD